MFLMMMIIGPAGILGGYLWLDESVMKNFVI